MEAVIVNFRGSHKTRYFNQMIIKVGGVESKDKAKSLLKKKVEWESPAGKKIIGKIVSVHGNSGCLRVMFEKGLPGQAIGTKVKVE